MKKLSDYKNEEAIELMADLIEPVANILADVNIKKAIQSNESIASLAKKVIKTHSKDACDIMLRIDDAPINGANAIPRFVSIINDFIENSESLKSFFELAEQEKTE